MKMMHGDVGSIFLGMLLLVGGLGLTSVAGEARRPNVLFIAVDDLRPELGCYGHPVVQSPHIDTLASAGVVFERAYCQQALCNPSRASLMTGRRPDTTRVWDLHTHFRAAIPDVITLPEHFKNHGYQTFAFGKIYHARGKELDDAPSWTDGATWHPDFEFLQRKAYKAETVDRLQHGGNRFGPAWEDPDVANAALPDGAILNEAVKTLQSIAHQSANKPFFLAVGFNKPHLPFIAPKKYYDLYPLEKIILPKATTPPKDAPELALRNNSGEIRRYWDMPKKGPVTDTRARELIRAYYACVSYVDDLVGSLLDELDVLGFEKNTLVILWGDHGWKLGEYGAWCKRTNFELDAHAPLILKVPGSDRRNIRIGALVEFVDIYPSLVDLCQLPMPEGLEGTSFVPLLKNPGRDWKKAAFSQHPRRGFMGYSMRTDRYRYTEWLMVDRKTKTAFWDNPAAVELYDHDQDPGETVNLAGHAVYQAAQQALGRMLRGGWRVALPNLEKTAP